MKQTLEALSEASAAAMLWFMSARIRLKKRRTSRAGLETGIDDPRALLLLVYEQSRWNAWAAIAASSRLFCQLRTDCWQETRSLQAASQPYAQRGSLASRTAPLPLVPRGDLTVVRINNRARLGQLTWR